jgi:DNA-directed RNA polymerase specialized sigma24 family protein
VQVDQEPDFGEFVGGRWPELVRVAGLITADPAAARASAASGLARAQRGWGRRPPGEASEYALGAVVRAAATRRAPSGPTTSLHDDAGPGNPADDDLLSTWRSLPPLTRAAVVLCLLEGRSSAEAGRILGRAAGLVRAESARGAARLLASAGPVPAGSTGPDAPARFAAGFSAGFEADLSNDRATDDLPPDLVRRLREVVSEAAATGEPGAPQPGVDLAIGRARRRRQALAGGVATLAAVVTGLAVIGPPASDPNPVVPPTLTSTPTPTLPRTMAEAGYTGSIGGTLGGDRAFLAALRKRAAATVTGQNGEPLIGADQVWVIWAGDLAGQRWATTLARRPAGNWQSVLLTGPAGAPAEKLQVLLTGTGGDGIPEPDGTFIGTPDAGPGAAAVAVIRAPLATRVEVATSRSVSTTGELDITWRPVRHEGMAWVGELSAAEASLASYRITSPAGTQEKTGVTSVNVPSRTPAAIAIAPAGSDRESVRCAAEQAGGTARATPSETPVITTSRRLSAGHAVAAVVLRSPGGGFLFGLCDRSIATNGNGREFVVGSVSRQAFPDAGAVMVVAQVDHERPGRLLVLAPAGAVAVSAGQARARVQNRLAILEIPRALSDVLLDGDVTVPLVEAVDAGGQVIGSARPIRDVATEMGFTG